MVVYWRGPGRWKGSLSKSKEETVSRSRSFSLGPGLGLFLFTFTLSLLTPAAYPQAAIPQCPNPPNGSSQPGPNHEEQPSRHPIRDFVPNPGSLATSTTTSGYAVTGSSFTLAEGSWVVPAVDCTEVPNAQSSFWVGLDGLTRNPTLEQIGTESYCSSTAAKYYAWYEFLPDQPTSVKIQNFTIKPGDNVSANVSFNASTSQFTVTIADGAQSYSCWYQLAEQASRSSAEWLAEDPVNSVTKALYPLADFAIADFGQGYTGIPSTNYAADASLPNPSPISAFGSAVQEIAMVKNNKVTEAIPSSLQSDGASFNVSTYLEFVAGTGASYEGTFPVSANKSGAVAGTYANPTNVTQGFLDSASGKLKLFNVPGAGTKTRQGTFGLSVNTAGTIAGYISDANNLYHAYYCPNTCSGTNASKIDVCKTISPNCPVAEFQQYDLGTAASAINDSGVLTGMWRDTNFVHHGWFLSGATPTSFDAPGAGTGPGQGTEPLAISSAGAISGLYLDSNQVLHGFVRAPSGTFTTVDPTGTIATVAAGINTAGTVAGTWADAGGVAHGFVCAALCQGGNPTTFDVPGAGGAACLISKHISITQGTVAFGINTAGDVTGVYTDANCQLHGFLRRAKNGQIYYPIDAPGGGTGPLEGTAGLSINDQEYVVGTFLDSNLAAHGFLHFVP
jgi:hypothetical protein